MAALTEDSQSRKRQEGVLNEHDVAASETIYKGALVCDNGSGYLVAAADDNASYIFVGVAAEKADNSSGSAGDETVRVYRKGVFQVPKSSAAVGDIGSKMYVKNDNEVAVSATNSVFAGVCIAKVDSSTIKLEIDGATSVPSTG